MIKVFLILFLFLNYKNFIKKNYKLIFINKNENKYNLNYKNKYNLNDENKYNLNDKNNTNIKKNNKISIIKFIYIILRYSFPVL